MARTKSGKAMVIEIRNADDIRTHNSLQYECADWTWQDGNLVHGPGQQRPIKVTPRMAESIAAALAAGAFPVELPYRVEDGTERLALRDEEPAAPPSVGDLFEDGRDALAVLDADAETTRTEYAVLCSHRGRTVASGPYSKRQYAERVAERDRGVVLTRTVTVDLGEWIVEDA